jgi:Lrp/AsnC family leucine-responsive transcriptional regulator
MSKKLDAFDIALINRLQADNLATAEELAQQVALSPSSISRRVKRLQENGLIAANVAILSPRLTASRLRAIIRIQTHEHGEEKGIAALRACLAAAPEVQLLVSVGGDFDLHAHVVTRDMPGFNAFIADHLSDACVRRYETSFVRAEHKNIPAVWLDQGDIGS